MNRNASMKCPRCGIAGNPSAVRPIEANAVCGTFWQPATGVVTTDGAACYVIEAKNDRIEELEYVVRDLRELAAKVVALTVVLTRTRNRMEQGDDPAAILRSVKNGIALFGASGLAVERWEAEFGHGN